MLNINDMESMEKENKLNIYTKILSDILDEAVEYKVLDDGQYIFYNPNTNITFVQAGTVEDICLASIYFGQGYKYDRPEKSWY